MDNNTQVDNEITSDVNTSKKKSKVGLIIAIIIICLILAGGLIWYFCFFNKKEEPKKEEEKVVTPVEAVYSYKDYAMEGNDLSNFDLLFLQMNNTKTNVVYSPLSIKYALAMLSMGADGDTKEEINTLIGNYEGKKYENSKNMTLANALFVKDSNKDDILPDYKTNLQNKYNAEVIYDNFKTAKVINTWVSNHTFNLINNILNDEDVSNKTFFLVNALGIDMSWRNAIQYQVDNTTVPAIDPYYIEFLHESVGDELNISSYVYEFEAYPTFHFEGMDENVVAAKIATYANKYDIVSDLGKENMLKMINDGYDEFLSQYPECDRDDTTAERNFNEVAKNYKMFGYSTDFSFYTDEDVTAFAKSLQTYGDTTLEYIGIMPNKVSLEEYIKNINSTSIKKIISNLKDATSYDSYEEGKITLINGNIPMFSIKYDLNLMESLQKMGINSVFDAKKADLSKLTNVPGTAIESVKHFTNIDFTNLGIKAASATIIGGRGSAGVSCDYQHHFDVSDKYIEIDETFNKPYLFLVHDKDTGEVWFAGSVYNPTTKYASDEEN